MLKFKILFLLPLITILTSLFLFSSSGSANTTKNMTNSSEVTEPMATITEDQYLDNIKNVSPISANNLIQKIKAKDSFIVFIGYKECPYCRKFSPTLKNFLSQSDKKIFYLDLDQFDSPETADSFQEIVKDTNLKYTPTVERISNGYISTQLIGWNTTTSQLKAL